MRSLQLVLAFLSLGVVLLGWRRALRVTRELADPHFTVYAWSELPPWVVGRLETLRDRVMGLGFRELACYSRRSQRTTFTCVLISPDRKVTAHLWVARAQGLQLLLTRLASGRAFTRDARGDARQAFVSDFSGGRRVETSAVEILATMAVPGELEFDIVPADLPLDEALRRHDALVSSFSARVGAEPLAILDEAQLFDVQRAAQANMIAMRERRVGA
jgi:hypothetical protein